MGKLPSHMYANEKTPLEKLITMTTKTKEDTKENETVNNQVIHIP
jgi:hypothetical protein